MEIKQIHLTKRHVKEMARLLLRTQRSYYNYYRIDNKSLYNFFFNELLRIARNRRNFFIIAHDKGIIRGFIIIAYAGWDSHIFSFKMAKLKNIIAATEKIEEDIKIKEHLVETAVNICRKRDIRHLATRVNADEFSSIFALEKRGFILVDSMATYVFNKQKRDTPVFKNLFKVRSFKLSDLKELMPLAGVSFLKNRFYNDLHLKHKASWAYQQWIKHFCLSNTKGSLIAEDRHGAPIGFLVYELNKKLAQHTQCRIIGHGLAAVKPTHKGAFLGLVEATIKRTRQYYDYAEFDAQTYNHEAVRIYNRFNFKLVKTRHTFHKWLIEDS
jgi:hypothetical protein